MGNATTQAPRRPRQASRQVRFRTTALVIIIVVAPLSGDPGGRQAAPRVTGDPGGPGVQATWTTGDKTAFGATAAGDAAPGDAPPVWFTVARGVLSEVFYPRTDVPDVQDMQYVVVDGSSRVELERDATDHVVSMPDDRALEYTVTNTARTGRYRLTTTYVTDPARATLLARTRFQSLDGGTYRLHVLFNPSLAAGGGGDTGGWDATAGALVASDTETLFGSPLPVASALAASTGLAQHTTGYSGTSSDGYRDLVADGRLDAGYDAAVTPGNVVQTAQIPVSGDTTFTLALGFGADRAAAVTAATGSLATGFDRAEAAYRAGWHAYLDGLRTPAGVQVPASVAGDPLRLRTYRIAMMTLHAGEDRTFGGAGIAAPATPWGDVVNGDTLNDGYHRVWARDLYQQATALLAAGDAAQATRAARWLWDRQQITGWTEGDGVWYGPGAFPRYSPVSGVAGATPQQLGCCEQLDQAAFAIILAYQVGLSDATTWTKIKLTADHIVEIGPDTPSERWEEQAGKSPSTIAAEIAGLVCAADLARRNGDPASAARYEAVADDWRARLPGWTFTTAGYFGDGRYFERVEHSDDPNDAYARTFGDGTWWERDIVDGGFLELVRLGVYCPGYEPVAESLPELDSVIRVTTPAGDLWYRYNHDSYGESQADGSGWPAGRPDRTGRAWPLLTGERGEYELAAGRPADRYLQTMAGTTNVGFFLGEQAWDRADQFGFTAGRPTGSATPLAWAEAQYVRLALAIDAGRPVETPEAVTSRYRGCCAAVT